MKTYTFQYMDGSILEWEAERDSLNKDTKCVILSNVKKQKGPIVKAGDEPEIIAVIPLYNLKFYTFKDNG